MNTWFRNGVPTQSVSINDRALQYGDGLFETIAVRKGKPRLWTYHMERLATGCKRLRITMPDVQVLRSQVDSAIAESTELPAYCAVKIIVSSGVGRRGYARAQPTAAETVIGVFPTMPLAKDSYRDGVITRLCDTRLATHSVTAGLKTLNRLEQVLARSECIASGEFEGLTLDADDRVICGTMSNVFIVSNDSISTPSLERCGVAGVMRRHTMETLHDNGIGVNVCDVSEAQLWNSDEVFLSNSQFGVLPVRRCGDREWHSRMVTRDVMAMLAGNGVVECAL